MTGRRTLLLLAAASFAGAQSLTFTPYHSNGVYEAGETVGWKVTGDGARLPILYKYTIRKNNLDVMQNGVLHFSSGQAALEVVSTDPAMIYVQIDPDPPLAGSQTRGHITLGAAVSPHKLNPSVPRPADFDSFWDSKLRALNGVAIKPKLTRIDTSEAGVELNAVTLDSLGSHVQGYIAKPARNGKFPALVIYQSAGVYALETRTATARAAEGWLALNVDSHDKPPYAATGAPADYQAVGNDNREASYFLNMYLRDARAIDYIASRPDWDGHTLVVMGISMGGQQSLVAAALRPDKVTTVLASEPSGADTNGNLHGRRTGYPNWPSRDPQVMDTALYFDIVNFASRIQAPALVALGFIDTTAPPVGIWTAINQIPGPKETIAMIESDHNNQTPEKQGAWYSRSAEVLSMLLRGETFKPNEDLR